MLKPHTTKSITIIGTGSLACLFTARLSQVARVQMIGSWQSQIKAINAQGITINELDGSVQTFPARAIEYPLQDNKPVTTDYVIVLVKSYQTSAVIERIKSYVNSGTLVLTLQNGLGNVETLTAKLPNCFVSGGITMQGANVKGLASIIHAGNGATIIDSDSRLTELMTLLNAAKLPTETARQSDFTIEEILWRKLIINTAINPLTALLGQLNGYLAANETAIALCKATARETAEVGILDGVWPESKLAESELVCVDMARLSAPNRSSMLQDITRGNRTEIDSMCGQVVERAKKHDRTAPLNQLWLELIQQAEIIEGGTKGLPLYSIQELAKLADSS